VYKLCFLNVILNNVNPQQYKWVLVSFMVAYWTLAAVMGSNPSSVKVLLFHAEPMLLFYFVQTVAVPRLWISLCFQRTSNWSSRGMKHTCKTRCTIQCHWWSMGMDQANWCLTHLATIWPVVGTLRMAVSVAGMTQLFWRTKMWVLCCKFSL
jgi:hypothetical protein